MRLSKTSIKHNEDGTHTVRHKEPRLIDKLAEGVTMLWEAIGDLRKNLGGLRLEVKEIEERTAVGFARAQKEVTQLRTDVDRSWSLAESRNSVHRKAEEELTNALQRFNERLSKLEGSVKIEADSARVERGKVGMISECIAAANQRFYAMVQRIQNLEELRVLYTTPYALENGDTLVVETTKPNGQGERISAKVYGPAAYAAHVASLTGANAEPVEVGFVTREQADAHIANGRGIAVGGILG